MTRNYPSLFSIFFIFFLLFSIPLLSKGIRIFDGTHDWPPKELYEGALEWMELQVIKVGKKEKDQAFLKRP